MDSIHKLAELFREFPGIGPRQARRFVYFLLTRQKQYRVTLSKLILALGDFTRECDICGRYFTHDAKGSSICDICRDKSRDGSQLLLVSRDMDLETVEKSGTYKGFYFVLGGSIPILEKAPESRIRATALVEQIEKRGKDIKEIIFALNVTPEGENTERYLRTLIAPLAAKNGFKIESLGRGLSTGLELEYSDSDTLKNAFKNRS